MPSPPRRSTSTSAPRPRKPAAKTSSRATRRTAAPRRKSSPLQRWFSRWPISYLAILVVGVALWFKLVHPGSKRGDADDASIGPRAASFTHAADLTTAEVDILRRAYIEDYGSTARREMNKFGIPASITLAQGLLESVAGTSRLATETNNHFGMKCFSRSCPNGHCRNFSDDHHKDFFRNYDHPRESFRAHSEFLVSNGRYKSLFELGKRDYKGWAQGLSKAGYATDPRYGDKLVSLIERYELAAFDE